jgi:hypothetical protein
LAGEAGPLNSQHKHKRKQNVHFSIGNQHSSSTAVVNPQLSWPVLCSFQLVNAKEAATSKNVMDLSKKVFAVKSLFSSWLTVYYSFTFFWNALAGDMLVGGMKEFAESSREE